MKNVSTGAASKQPQPSLAVKDQSDGKMPGWSMWHERNGLYSSEAFLKHYAALK